MGLFDNIANQMNPRNDATDLAIILDNREQEQQAAERAFRDTFEIEQMALYQLDQNLRTGQHTKEQTSAWISRDPNAKPEDMSLSDGFKSYAEDFYRRQEVDKGTYGMKATDIFALLGEDKFYDYINLSGMASEFLGPGKRLDETSSTIYKDENGEIFIIPKVRTVDPETGNIRTNNMTTSGRDENEIAAEGGAEAVDLEAVGAIPLSKIDDLMRVYKKTKADQAGIDTNLRFFNESEADLFNEGVSRQERLKILEGEATAAQEGVTAAEAALETAKAAPTPSPNEDNVVNYGAGYGIKEDGSLPMGEELAGLLFTEEDRKEPIEGIGMRERIQNFEQGLAPSPTVVREQVSKKDGYLETPGLEPKNLTEEQYLSLSPNERNRLDALSKKQTAETLEAIHTDADKAFNKAMGERGQTQVQEAKAWYTGNKKKLDEVFQTNPEARAEFNADPVAFSKKYMNDSNNNDLFGKPAPKEERDLIKEGVGDADPKKAAEAVVNKDIKALEAELDKAKKLSAEKEQALVDFNTQVHNGNMMRMSKTDRSSVMINYLASIREDRKIYQQMIQSMPVFLETGMWSLTGETLRVNQAKADNTRANHLLSAEKWAVEQLGNSAQLSDDGSKFYDKITQKNSDDELYLFTDWESASSLSKLEFGRISSAMAGKSLAQIQATPGLMQDYAQVANFNMQVFKNYVEEQLKAPAWKEILTLGFAQDPDAEEFTLNPNVVAYDDKNNPITDPNYLLNGGKVAYFKSSDNRGGTLYTSELKGDLGKEALNAIFNASVANQLQKG